MTEFKGSSHDGMRVMALERKRELEREEMERKKRALRDGSDRVAKMDMGKKFKSETESTEEQLRKETYGLVTKADFTRKREDIERLAAERRKRELEAAEKERIVKRLKRRNQKHTLSFHDDEDGEDDSDDDVFAALSRKPTPAVHATATTDTAAATPTTAAASSAPPPSKRARTLTPAEEDAAMEARVQEALRRRKFGKDPSVRTDFLPDREREAVEASERHRLKKEWLAEQQKIKDEGLEVTYSYWDGSGHRNRVHCNKGTTIGKFLDLVRGQQKEIRTVSVDSLMYIKEDMIIPHHLSFYDMIVTKARGKSGPLFNFDVHDDVRLVADATREKDESHAGKVCERRWYERNKHIFPASRWEVYDPSVKRTGPYTIKDTKATH